MPTLPPRPSLEHLKKQAKDLLQARDVTTIAQYVDQPDLKLATAQLAVARMYGFDSWAKLKAHVEAANADWNSAANGFVIAAMANDLVRADALLAQFPDLPEQDPWARLAYGGDTLPETLDVKAKGGPANVEPLLVACLSGYLRHHARAPHVRKMALQLLERGADPNVRHVLDDSWKTEEMPLYGAAGLAVDPELTAALIAHGARPDDNETLYHSSEHGPDNRCLKLVLEAKPPAKLLNYCIKRKLDFEDPEGLQLYLDHGVDLNAEPEAPTLQHAIIRHRSLAIVEMLLKAGADPNQRSHLGFTSYQAAFREGQLDVAEMLAAHGADTTLSPTDLLIGKAMSGEPVDPSEWKDLPITRADQEVIAKAAEFGKADALRTLMQAGFSPNGLDHYGALPIHWAALNGYADAVRVLAEAGAKLDQADTAYKSLPIGYAAWASVNMNNPKGDYPTTVRTLLELGSPLPETDFGSDEVAEILRQQRAR